MQKLTRRELELLQMVVIGHSDRKIADELAISIRTVRFHLSNIFRKIGVRNRTSAATWFNSAQKVARLMGGEARL